MMITGRWAGSRYSPELGVHRWAIEDEDGATHWAWIPRDIDFVLNTMDIQPDDRLMVGVDDLGVAFSIEKKEASNVGNEISADHG